MEVLQPHKKGIIISCGRAVDIFLEVIDDSVHRTTHGSQNRACISLESSEPGVDLAGESVSRCENCSLKGRSFIIREVSEAIMDLEESGFKDIEVVSGDNVLLKLSFFNIFVDVCLKNFFNFGLESFKLCFALFIGCGESWEDTSLSSGIDVVFGVSIVECGFCSSLARKEGGVWSSFVEVSEFIRDEVCQSVVEVGHFSRDLCFKNIGVIIGRKTSFVKLLACFEFFDSLDGFV